MVIGIMVLEQRTYANHIPYSRISASCFCPVPFSASRTPSKYLCFVVIRFQTCSALSMPVLSLSMRCSCFAVITPFAYRWVRTGASLMLSRNLPRLPSENIRSASWVRKSEMKRRTNHFTLQCFSVHC